VAGQDIIPAQVERTQLRYAVQKLKTIA